MDRNMILFLLEEGKKKIESIERENLVLTRENTQNIEMQERTQEDNDINENARQEIQEEQEDTREEIQEEEEEEEEEDTRQEKEVEEDEEESEKEDKSILTDSYEIMKNVKNITKRCKQDYIIAKHENIHLNEKINKPGLSRINNFMLCILRTPYFKGLEPLERKNIYMRFAEGVPGRVLRNKTIEWQEEIKEKTQITKLKNKEEHVETLKKSNTKQNNNRKKRSKENKAKNVKNNNVNNNKRKLEGKEKKKRQEKERTKKRKYEKGNEKGVTKSITQSKGVTKSIKQSKGEQEEEQDEETRNYLRDYQVNKKTREYIEKKKRSGSLIVSTTSMKKLLGVLNNNVFEINQTLTELIYPISTIIEQSIQEIERKTKESKERETKALQILYKANNKEKTNKRQEENEEQEQEQEEQEEEQQLEEEEQQQQQQQQQMDKEEEEEEEDKNNDDDNNNNEEENVIEDSPQIQDRLRSLYRNSLANREQQRMQEQQEKEDTSSGTIQSNIIVAGQEDTIGEGYNDFINFNSIFY